MGNIWCDIKFWNDARSSTNIETTSSGSARFETASLNARISLFYRHECLIGVRGNLSIYPCSSLVGSFQSEKLESSSIFRRNDG